MILAVLQARMSSTRLPGKVLEDVCGEPMIIRQLERIKFSRRLDDVVLATSDEESDDVLAQIVEQHGFKVVRGALDDVVGRFALAVATYQPDIVVRLTGDCPLTDFRVIDAVIDGMIETHSDYGSNVHPPTFADGLDVEAFTSTAFAKMSELVLTEKEREHVTMGFYNHPAQFKMWNHVQSPDRSELRWTVDVADDLEFVRTIFEALYEDGQYFGQSEILDWLREHPAFNRTQDDVARNAGSS